MTKAARKVNTSAFDGLRGLAAIVIGLFHVTAFQHSRFEIAGLTAVPVFYLLSGFVLELNYGNEFCDGKYSANDYWVFILRRVARIYPMYFLLNIACVPVYGLVAKDFTIRTFVCSIFLVTNILPLGMEPPLQVSWTISAIFGLYLVFPFLSTLVQYLDSANVDGDPKPTRLMTIAILSGMLYLLGGIVSLLYHYEGQYYNVTASAFLVFLSGICIGRFRRLQAESNHSPSRSSRDEQNGDEGGWTMSSDIAFVLVFMLFIASTVIISISRFSETRSELSSFDKSPDMERYASYGAAFLSPIPFVLGVYALTQGAQNETTGTFDAVVLHNPTLKRFGEISMTFYLCHAIPMYYVYCWIGDSGLGMHISIVYCFVLAFPAASLLSERVEQPIHTAFIRLLPLQQGSQKVVKSMLGQSRCGDDKGELAKSLLGGDEQRDEQREPAESRFGHDQCEFVKILGA